MAPFKSLSQKRAFLAKVKSGEISQATYDEWDRSTPKDKLLPERVGKKITTKEPRKPRLYVKKVRTI